MNPAPPALLRRLAALTVCGITMAVVSVALAGPAAADVPQLWDEPPAINLLHVLGYLVGVPILLFVAIVAFIYVPPVVRGESVRPGTGPVSDQWLGGPRKSAGELAAPDSETSAAGGGSGRW